MSKTREKFLVHNTLACLLKGCEGSITTLELRNESHVTGRIIEADGFMNVTMREAVYCDPAGKRVEFDRFFIPSRLIRSVQIPSQINIVETINKQVYGFRGGKSRSEITVGGARKKIMAKREKRQLEDVQNAIKLKEEMKR